MRNVADLHKYLATLSPESLATLQTLTQTKSLAELRKMRDEIRNTLQWLQSAVAMKKLQEYKKDEQ